MHNSRTQSEMSDANSVCSEFEAHVRWTTERLQVNRVKRTIANFVDNIRDFHSEISSLAITTID